MTLELLQSEGYQKIKEDLQFIMNCFRTMLLELGKHKVAHSLPWANPSGAMNAIAGGLKGTG